MASSRFPGKPLAPILGRPMIEHVYRRVKMSEQLADVIVATCDEEIKCVVEAFGGRVAMTSEVHERASDRVAEAAQNLDADIVVMVQGDEPMTEPGMIDASLAPFFQPNAPQCVNLLKRIESAEEFENRDTIKVVMDNAKRALYMSREPIPTLRDRDFSSIEAYKQVCIIPFTRECLAQFARLEPSSLEIAESVDMMRLIQHEISVQMVETTVKSHAVDRPKDVELVEHHLQNDPLLKFFPSV